MLSITSSIPSIRITPAPLEEIHLEPSSPIPSVKLDVEDDGYTSKWLSLPPLVDASSRHSLPLRPADGPLHKGLGRHQFVSLPKVSRNQRANLQTKPDLRKESVLKNQAFKLERRAPFLSKVRELSWTETILASTPKVSLGSRTTAHSPRRFEFSTLETLTFNPEDLAIVASPTDLESHKQVEHGPHVANQLRGSSKVPYSVQKNPGYMPPSLDEITARLKPAQVPSTKDCPQSRLPGFLKAPSSSPGAAGGIKASSMRSFTLNDEKFDATFVRQLPPFKHPDTRATKLGSEHVVAPRPASVVAGPTPDSSRADTARDMIVTLKRRSSLCFPKMKRGTLAEL